MTREEAIIDLNALKFILDNDQYTDEIEEALDVAIEALQQPEIVRCKDCKHYYFADNCIPQEQRYTCELDGDRWNPDSYCSYAERKKS